MPPEFSIRASSVDVEQIMKQIRTRIREKRGVDYTEDEIRELASIKLEKFLDPSRVRSELLEHYRKGRPSPSATPVVVPPAPPNYTFEAETAYLSSRGAMGRTLYALRRLLNPVLKLFINPTPMIHVLHMQSRINRESAVRFDRFLEQWQERESRRTELDALGYEVAHNLVLEMTRLGIEVKNLKMRIESLSSRLDFSERRARALESVVQYRSGAGTEPAGRPGPGGDDRRREERGREERGRDGRSRDGRARDERARDERRREERGREERGREERASEARGPEAEGAAGIPKGEAQRSRRKRRRRGRGTGQGQGPQGPEAATPQQGQLPVTEEAAGLPEGGEPPRREADAGTPAPGPVQPEPPAWPEDPGSRGPDEQ